MNMSLTNFLETEIYFAIYFFVNLKFFDLHLSKAHVDN